MTDMQEIITNIRENFNKEAASGMQAVFQLNFKDNDDYYLSISNGDFTVEKGTHDSPSVALNTDIATLKNIITGNLNGMQAVMLGKVKLSGDMSLAMKLNGLFSK